MEPASLAAHPTQRQLLAHLLTEGRLQAGLDLATAAERWGHSPDHLKATEAGNAVPDWWQLRSLLAVYGLDFTAFVVAFEARLAALGAAPAPDEDPFLGAPLR